MRYVYQPNAYSQQRQKEKPVTIYPVHLAMEATHRRNLGYHVSWDMPARKNDIVITQPEDIHFLDLPAPDRVFTNAFACKYQRYGNYKYHPATHMMASLDCWYHQCTFCEWAKRYPVCKTREVRQVIHEVDECIELGFKEIFDDSGTFPIGLWLSEFCHAMRKRNITLGCNMRINNFINFDNLKKAHFRMILFGVESFNQLTLDRLNKGIEVPEIIPCIARASKSGIEPHIAVMVGYPWESYHEEMQTINKVKWLLQQGYAKTAQVSIYSIPGQAPIDRGTKNKIYDVAWSPEFWFNKLRDIHNLSDFLYLLKSIRKGVIRD